MHHSVYVSGSLQLGVPGIGVECVGINFDISAVLGGLG